jgi:hypothetical protein
LPKLPSDPVEVPARPNDHAHPTDLPRDHLDLTRVHAGAYLDAERLDPLDDRSGALRGAGWTVERGEELVAGSVDLLTAIEFFAEAANALSPGCGVPCRRELS